MANILRAGLAAAGLAGLVAFGAVPAFAQQATQTYKATMTAANEVPPNQSQGTGTADLTYDPATKMLTWTVTYQNLTGPATAGHLHGPAQPGQNAGVAVPFQAPLTSPIKGSATLTDAQAADLQAGRYYANVHTAANPGGEIRGQVTKQ